MTISIGKLQLRNRIIISPLAGCSDFPFRQMAARYRPGLHFCEMVKMEALIHLDPSTLHLLDYSEQMLPLGAQLVGGNPKLAGKAAQIIEEAGFSSVDLNCGCPVDRVTKDGSGSGLLKTPQKIGEILSNMVAAVKIPVTVKIRAGWDEETINCEEITKIAEAAGAQAIAIHGRTRKQAYKGDAVWDYITRAKKAAKTIKVFGNGDVFSAEAALKMFEQTNCDAILVSRGAMGEPWIVEDIEDALAGRPPKERGFNDAKEALKEHFECIVRYRPERRALLDIRRVGCWYMKKGKNTREFRHAISRAESIEEARKIIEALEE